MVTWSPPLLKDVVSYQFVLRCVRPSICPSIHLSVHPFVRQRYSGAFSGIFSGVFSGVFSIVLMILLQKPLVMLLISRFIVILSEAKDPKP